MINNNIDKNASIWTTNIDKYLVENNMNTYELKFIEKFEERMNQILSEYPYSDLCQLSEGNRLRPKIVLWTFLCNYKPLKVSEVVESDIAKIIDVCIGVELLHKASLVFDDMIDKDIARKGKPTFHVMHGNDKAAMFGLNLTVRSLSMISSVLYSLDIDESIIKKGVALSIETAHQMSIGVLKELELTKETIFQLDKIKEIVSMQVPSLVKDCLLIGYYCGGGNNSIIEDAFIEIGDIAGFFFQLLNDMEPYLNIENNINHKSDVNYDFLDNRKSTVSAYLGEFLSNAEKRKYKSLTDDEKKKAFVFKKIKKYKLIDFLHEEINLMQEKMKDCWEDMARANVDPFWHKCFWDFLNVLISAGKKRLGK